MKSAKEVMLLWFVCTVSNIAIGQLGISNDINPSNPVSGVVQGSIVHAMGYDGSASVCDANGKCAYSEAMVAVATAETTVQLAALKQGLQDVKATLDQTNAQLTRMADVLKNNKIMLDDLDKFKAQVLLAIDQRFQNLPAELGSSDVIKQLKIDIKTEVEQDLKPPQPQARNIRLREARDLHH